MRSISVPLVLPFAVIFAASGVEPEATYPLWDGQETVEQYAKRAGLEPAKTLDLGNGVKLELVLIPAGKFVMGTPEFVEPPESPVTGRAILVLGGGLVAALLLILGIRAARRRRWPQFSLGFLVLLALALAVALWGGVREWQARAEYREYTRSVKRAALGHDIGHFNVYSAREDLDETAHEVTISRPFYLSRFEVTQAQYEEVVCDNPTARLPQHGRGPSLGPDRPVVTMDWEQTQGFCLTVELLIGERLRLPTEAEWEFACRAGTRTNYYSGDTEENLERVAWYTANSIPFTRAKPKPRYPFPVGKKAPNAFGLHDMHGNVSEWCQDFYGEYCSGPVVDPQGPEEGGGRILGYLNGPYHVARGGSCNSGPTFCRSARRFVHVGWYYVGYIGFRVAADVEEPAAPRGVQVSRRP